MSAEVQSNLKLEVAHVLFLDIVGYSKLLTDDQHQAQQLLREVVRNSAEFGSADAEGKLVRLPTGDGVALVFFTTPEAPIKCAVEISEALRAHPQLRLRMGVHSGPVSNTTDLNDKSNIAGAGINTAQRVMDCGDAGHILLSKRAADDLAEYRQWQPRLHYLGEVEVKHGVRLGLVNLYTDTIGNAEVPEKLKQARASEAATARAAVRRHRKKMLFAAGAAAVVLLAAILAIFLRRAGGLTTAIVEKSIAVLPFENFSDDKENNYFADGVQDDILTDLSKVADLKVISRRSVAQYRGTAESIRAIGRALQVAYVLEGTVRKVEGHIRVTAQLIDTRTEAEKWAEKYERDIADLFAIQSDISQTIVSQLKATLAPAEKAAIQERPTQDLEAYDLYLRARTLVYGFGVAVSVAQQNMEKAIKLLDSAIARDPKFSDAYSLLGEAQLTLYGAEFLNKARLPKAKEAIEGALRISPQSPQAHLTYARYLYYGVRDTDGAEKELAIAATSLPGDVDLLSLRAEIAEQRGRWLDALREREKSCSLDPRSPEPAGLLMELYIELRNYSDAEKLADKMIASIPQQSTGSYWRGKSKIAVAKGDTKAAMAALDAHPMRNAGLTGLNAMVANVLIMQRQYAKATELLLSLGEQARSHNILPKGGDHGYGHGTQYESLAIIARAQGQTDKARGYFETARAGFDDWLGKNFEELSEYEAKARGHIAMIDAALGQKEKGIEEGRYAVELWPMTRNARIAPQIRVLLATTYTWAGDHAAALNELSQVVKLPYGPTAGELKLNPIWDDIRNDPPFAKIVADAAAAPVIQ